MGTSSSEGKKKHKRKSGTEETPHTEEETRKVCRDWESLRKETKDNADYIVGGASDEGFDGLLDTAKRLVEQVKTPREALASNAFGGTLVDVQKKTVETMGSTSKFDRSELIETLRTRYIEESCMDWESLGNAVAPFFSPVPHIEFMLGALAPVEAKKQKPKEKREKKAAASTAKVVEAETVDRTADRKDPAPLRQKEMYLRFKKLCPRSSDSRCFFQFIIQTKSFSETIENVFDLDSLVKENKLTLGLDDNLLPRIGDDLDAARGGGGGDSSTKQQFISSFSMEGINRIREELGIEEGDMPYRGGPADSDSDDSDDVVEDVEDDDDEEEEEEEAEDESPPAHSNNRRQKRKADVSEEDEEEEDEDEEGRELDPEARERRKERNRRGKRRSRGK